MTAAVGLPTLRLIRTAIGPFSVEGLQPGEWREVAAGRGGGGAGRGQAARACAAIRIASSRACS